MIDPEETPFFEFMYLSIALRFWKIWDYGRTLFRYYLLFPKFFLVDSSILISSFFSSPYRTLRLYQEGKNSSFGPYGETPFRTLELCIEKFKISIDATWIDLGCGRARALFWLQMVRKQKKIIGIETYPKWCLDARRRADFFRIENIRLINSSIIEFLLSYSKNQKESVIYIYLSSMQESDCVNLGRALSTIKGLLIISVSFSFQEYGVKNIELIDSGSFSFPWGEAEIYYQRVI
ncbi:MAG: hypothetical protein QRY74_01120 [Chlamydia sp.]